MREELWKGLAGSERAEETASPEVSVLIPFGSRHEDPAAICEGLRRVFAQAGRGHEVIFIDEANGPNTRTKLRAIGERFPEVRVIRLERAMGESTALAIGARWARGNVLVTLDPYLHVAVEELPKLLEPLSRGFDLACAVRRPRAERGLSRFASAGFNAVARWLTKVPVHDLNCRTRAMRTNVIRHMPVYGDLHRFMPIFAARQGFSWCEVAVPQQSGKREIGAHDARSYVRGSLDLLTLMFLTRFVKRPLHFFGLLGGSLLAAGLLVGLYLTYVKLALGMGIGHRPLMLLAVLLVAVGVQVASIGLLGEIMIFTHAKDIRDYLVEEEVGGAA